MSKNARSVFKAAQLAKYPRHAVDKALRIPRVILEQNAGKECAETEAAKFLGVKLTGRVHVEISSGVKYGFLAKPSRGRLTLTDLARKALRPKHAEDVVTALREAILRAPDFSAVYKHYRGENLPDSEFFDNALVDMFNIPAEMLGEFKQLFFESLASAKLIDERDGKRRLIDISTDSGIAKDASDALKQVDKVEVIGAGDTCFVMMPFAAPIGTYYAQIYEAAIRRAGLRPVRADDDIFATGKIIDQVWSGINAARVLVAELTSRNPNVFYELGLAHALRKPVVLVSSNEPDVPFDVRHIRVIYYDVTDPFWGEKLISKVADNIVSAVRNPEEAIFRTPSPLPLVR